MPDVSPLRKIFSVETGMNETTPLRMECCNSTTLDIAMGMSDVIPSATLQYCNGATLDHAPDSPSLR